MNFEMNVEIRAKKPIAQEGFQLGTSKLMSLRWSIFFNLKHHFGNCHKMTPIILHFACKFALICVFAIKDLQETRMENVFQMASVYLLMNVDRTNIAMNVEILARNQTAMMIQTIHPFVLSVSVFSHNFSLSDVRK